MDYVNSKRLDKPLVALDIIKQWRGQDPPGRFLKIDDRSGLWNDVGDKKVCLLCNHDYGCLERVILYSHYCTI